MESGILIIVMVVAATRGQYNNMASITGDVPVPEPLSAKYKESFAYITVKDRLPIIVTKTIDFLYRERHEIAAVYGEEAREESKDIVGYLSKLKNEIQTNKPVIPLTSSGLDVPLWNVYLKHQTEMYGFEPKWFESPWLYVECYMYRRMKEAFELSKYLKSFDPFRKQKKMAFHSSMDAIIALATNLQRFTETINSEKNGAQGMNHFFEFIEVSLWGNKCDLSLSAGKENCQMPNPFSHIGHLREYILVNDTNILWDILQEANLKHRGNVRLDIVLDNASFELFTDLCLLDFLEQANLVHKVHLYVKEIPWFVSDTLTDDVSWILKTLSNSDNSLLSELGIKWRNKLELGKWIIEREYFWTLPHDYSEMRQTDPHLYHKLSNADVIIFKGDLNYRKLTSDRQWPFTTPFINALRGFLPAPLCTLRTIKADVVVGLKSGQGEELKSRVSDWMTTGEYAVIQCASSSKKH